jgi:hypothetical protein
MKLNTLILILLVFIGCGDKKRTLQDFIAGKELSCSYNTLFTFPTIINNKTWTYSKNLDVFYDSVSGSSFSLSACDSE